MSSVFLQDRPSTRICPLSLHDALPIFDRRVRRLGHLVVEDVGGEARIAEQLGALGAELCQPFDDLPRVIRVAPLGDRKSTRLNSSHRCISYAVFCLKKKERRRSRYTYR